MHLCRRRVLASCVGRIRGQTYHLQGIPSHVSIYLLYPASPFTVCCLLLSWRDGYSAPPAASSFARQTGDLRSLSRVDLRVIALTYMLERQETGATHLRTAPVRPVSWFSQRIESISIQEHTCTISIALSGVILQARCTSETTPR